VSEAIRPEPQSGDDGLVRDALENGLSLLCRADCGIDSVIAPRFEIVVSLLARYVGEIRLCNPALGLVGTNEPGELVARHVLDSLSPLGIMAGRIAGLSPAVVADVGSGAGLPGIPLAIAMPNTFFTLIERKGRRAGFLRETVKALELRNVAVEEAEMEKAKSGRFDLVTFRAFRPLEPKIYKKLSRLCTAGGMLAAYKGRLAKTEAEMAALEQSVPTLVGRWEILPCPVPGLDEERHLVVVRSQNA